MSARRPSFLAALRWLAALAWAPCTGTAHAQAPVTEVEADALLSGRPSEGTLVLRGGYGNAELVDADALVFLGASADGSDADVLTMTVGVREPHGLGQARLGRFVLATGAVRPVHLDGAIALGRAPSGTTLELFGGLPVVPELGARDFDWLAGARIGQQLWEERLGAGVSYVQRRDAGQLDDEEVGADAHAAPLSWLDLHLVGAWDLVRDGLAEARASAAARGARTSIELFAVERVAARLLPATSLFSVLGDTRGRELGGDVLWHAFPRLDLGATLALDAQGDALGYRGGARATLRFSDESGALGGDLALSATRRSLRDQGFNGWAADARWPWTRRLSSHVGVELVAADEPGDRGALWPWLRAGAGYALGDGWTLAAGFTARASPEQARELEALVRVGYAARLGP